MLWFEFLEAAINEQCFVQAWDLKNVCPEPLPIEKQMYKITTKSLPMFVLPEPAAAGCHVANAEDNNVLPQFCQTPC